MILSTLRPSVSGTRTNDVPELREESRGRVCLEVPARIGMVSLGPAHRESLMISFEPRHWRRALIGLLVAAVLALTATPSPAGEPAPAGRAVMAWHVTISPSWFDPSTAPPQITPFGMLYAIHDALVRPYPGHKYGPKSRGVVAGEPRWEDVRVQAASGSQVSQWRPADDRGREVQLR